MSDRLLREFCAENFTSVPAAIAAGAARIELCDNLAVGGTGPTVGVIQAAVAYAHEHGARVMTMIRPRGGDFVYTDDELRMMSTDLEQACRCGTDGVAFGCLKEREDGQGYTVDTAAVSYLMNTVRWMRDRRSWSFAGDGSLARSNIDVTFHMAFDELDHDEQLRAIDFLAQEGVTRILTHGGPKSAAIEENLDHLRELIAYADGRIIILPGAGISYENALDVAHALGVDEVHGTRIVKIEQ